MFATFRSTDKMTSYGHIVGIYQTNIVETSEQWNIDQAPDRLDTMFFRSLLET